MLPWEDSGCLQKPKRCTTLLLKAPSTPAAVLWPGCTEHFQLQTCPFKQVFLSSERHRNSVCYIHLMESNPLG